MSRSAEIELGPALERCGQAPHPTSKSLVVAVEVSAPGGFRDEKHPAITASP